MSAAVIASTLLSDPRVRQMAKKLAIGGVKALGRSRRRRANRKQWYFGKRIGVPPNMPRRGAGVRVSRPLAVATTSQSRVASSYTITGEEVMTTLKVTGGGTPQLAFISYPVNIAEPVSFPRASQVAGQYQKYRINSLSLSYVSRLPSTTTGMIAMALQADPTAPDPTTLNEVCNLAGSVTDTIYQSLSVPLPASLQAALGKDYLIKVQASPQPISDSPLNTAARLVIVTDGVADGTNIGQILVRYSVTFSDPRVNPDGATASAVFQECSVETSRLLVPMESVEGVAPFWPRHVPNAATLYTKRTAHPLLLYLEFDEPISGVTIVAGDSEYEPRHVSSTATATVAVFFIPGGNYDFYISVDNAGAPNVGAVVYATTLGVRATL